MALRYVEKILNRRERRGHPQRARRKAFNRDGRDGSAKRAKKGVHPVFMFFQNKRFVLAFSGPCFLCDSVSLW